MVSFNLIVERAGAEVVECACVIGVPEVKVMENDSIVFPCFLETIIMEMRC